MLLDTLERGKQRRELRDEVDAALVVEMMVGAHFARRFGGRAIPRDWAERIIDQIWPAIERR
jgi:hypothetical protein